MNKVDKAKAIELRNQGKTYLQITEILGCSMSWCKQTLKEFKKPVMKCKCCGRSIEVILHAQ
jgi:hypothetical protein